jgi:hypothetical protein
LRVNPAAAHVPVLGHGDICVTQMVGPDAGGQSFIVDQSGEGLTEAVRGDVGRTKSVPNLSPLLIEVVGVAQCSPGCQPRSL